MWIRRSFGNDPLYHTVVQTYIDVILQQGYNFECFIEGGRSRTGKLLSPKFGILNFIVDSLLSGRVEDAVICPVSTQYDKVIETEYGFLVMFCRRLSTDFRCEQILHQRTSGSTQAQRKPGKFPVLLFSLVLETGPGRRALS